MELRIESSLSFSANKCRLCACDSFNGVPIFSENNLMNDISSLINKHLPLKVEKDGIFPNIICLSCNLQLHATIDFFDKIRQGQDRLEALLVQIETEFKSKTPPTDENLSSLPNDNLMVFTDNLYPEINIGDSSSPLDSDLSLILETKKTDVSKKRGRPPKEKSSSKTVSPLNLPEIDNNSLHTSISVSRVRRKRQLPLRYQEAIQDKELDKMFHENFDNGCDDAVVNRDRLSDDCTPKVTSSEDSIAVFETKVIKEDVSISKRARKFNPRRQKQAFVCEICGKGFLLKCYFMKHKAEHEGSIIECKNCFDSFLKQESYEAHFILNPQCAALSNSTDGDENKTNNTQLVEIKKQDFVCKLCNKVFSHEPSLALHQKAVHEDGKPYTCSLCDKSFSSVISLKTHIIHLHKVS